MRFLFFIFAVTASILLSMVSSAKPVPVEHYARLPAIFDAAISPDGQWLATVVDNKGEYILRVFNMVDPNDRKTRATALEKGVVINWLSWANNNQLLLSTTQTVKRRRVIFNMGFLFVLNRDLNTMKLVLKPDIDDKRMVKSPVQRQFNNVVLDMLPDEPDYILMAFGIEDRFVHGVHKVNIQTRSHSRVKRGSRDVQSWTMDLRHEVRVGEGQKDGSGDYRMIVRDTVGDKWREVSEYPGLTVDTNIYGFTENPDEMIIGAYDGKDTLGLFIYDLSQKKRTRKLFQHEDYDVTGIIKSFDGTKIVGATYIGENSKKVFFDPADKARIAKMHEKLKGYQIRIIDQTSDGQKVIFKASAPNVPSSLFLYDFNLGGIGALGSDYPEIGTTQQGDVIKVTYKARDGFEIPGFVTAPAKVSAEGMALKNLPFIILPHGGPYARDTNSYDSLAQFMASRGYGVLQMNFRGSSGYGRSFKQAGRKNWEVMQEDVEDGTRWLIEKGYADPKRICIVGWSYGGYAALMGAAKNPELYACSVSVAGLTDPRAHVKSMKDYRFGRFSAQNFILDGFEDKDDIKENSPVKRAKEFTVPVLLAHGEKDVTVRYNQFTRMKSALKKSKVKHTMLSFKNGDHSLKSFEDRKKLFVTMDRFLRDNLGESSAAP